MSDPLAADATASAIAAAVRTGKVTATEVMRATLDRIRTLDPALNAFTAMCSGRALDRARALDIALARGPAAGPLAGVPFAVKAQIAVAGLVTTAGSKLHANDPPARRDAEAVARLERSGAICVGVTNMDEFGMGGTTENRYFGPSRNPHDRTRTPGGSSGGSAAAVAGGLVPAALGSDALGSVRLPAALCGVHGLRPTRGAVPGDGLLPSPGSITTIGPLARSIDDLATFFAVIAGRERAASPGDVQREAAACPIGVPGGYFRDNLDGDTAEALAIARHALANTVDVEFPEANRARAAAVLVNAGESAGAQLDRLRRSPDDFDPLTRDRFLAHALLPAGWYFRAQAFRRWHKAEVLRLLQRFPVLLFPATPCVAPPIGTRTLRIDGLDTPTGPGLGLFTQPLAGLDCPVLAVPIARAGRLPAGVQLLAAPGDEARLFDVARLLERRGVARAPIATF